MPSSSPLPMPASDTCMSQGGWRTQAMRAVPDWMGGMWTWNNCSCTKRPPKEGACSQLLPWVGSGLAFQSKCTGEPKSVEMWREGGAKLLAFGAG